MEATHVGSIPTRLVAVQQKAIPNPCGGAKIFPAFVTDYDAPKTLQTAISWANRGGRGATVEVPNDPIPSLRVVEMEIRMEGGRAWKVVTPQGWYVDLREDVLVDHLYMHKSISVHPEGGWVLEGPFLWVKNGTQMRMVLIDSPRHRQILAYTKQKAIAIKAKKISPKSLVAGGVYIKGCVGATDLKVCLGCVRYQGVLYYAITSLWDWKTPDAWRAHHNIQRHTSQLFSSNNNWCSLIKAPSYTYHLCGLTLPKGYRPRGVSLWEGKEIPLDQVEWL